MVANTDHKHERKKGFGKNGKIIPNKGQYAPVGATTVWSRSCTSPSTLKDGTIKSPACIRGEMLLMLFMAIH